METILVTGGAGFIGSHLTLRLLASGRAVRVLDNFDPFYQVSIKRRHVDEFRALAPEGAFELIEGDFRDPETCARAVRGIDGLVHLGALAGVRPSIADPIRYMDVNVTGTQTLLESVSDRSDLKVVFASSSSVYGGNRKVPFAETDPVDRPVSPYAASKKAGEVLCHAHHHLHGNPLTCLRFFTVYGPGQRPEMAIHLFSRRLVSGQPIPMFGDGSTRRDYTYIDDIVDGVMAALERCAGYRIFNLGGSQTTELSKLIRTLGEVFGIEPQVERLPDQQGDVPQTWADTSLAEQELGFCSKVDIREGLTRFRDWYLKEREAGRVE